MKLKLPLYNIDGRFSLIFQCFSTNELFQELNISVEAEVNKGQIPELCMNLLSKLLQRRCIAVKYQNPLPCPSYFVGNLFKQYARNDVINKENMQELMENLKIGKQEKNESGSDSKTSKDKLARKKRRAVAKQSLHQSLVAKLSSSRKQKQQQDGKTDANIYEKVCKKRLTSSNLCVCVLFKPSSSSHLNITSN